MNVFDIITLIVLLWAIFSGWRSGFTSQCFSFAGIVVGVVLSVRFGKQVGGLMGLDPQFATIVGFITVFVVTVIVSGLLARLLRKFFSAIGLGSVDVLLGIALSIVKFSLILSIVFCSFNSLNKSLQLLDNRYIEESKSFRPVSTISEQALKWLNEYFKTYAQ
ncbi:MAG: CvpA family protein [Alistipes sp.]|nr:CvpA family protein [Alistipes sp.]